MKKRLAFKPISLSALEDEWQQLATREAIAAARNVVRDGPIPSNAPVERLTDQDWGWIVAAILFGWNSSSRSAFSFEAPLSLVA
jgi:hypothetical protein